MHSGIIAAEPAGIHEQENSLFDMKLSHDAEGKIATSPPVQMLNNPAVRAAFDSLHLLD
jgi:hypothetical protein